MKNRGKEAFVRILQVGLGAGTTLLSAYYLSKASEREALSERLKRLEELIEKAEKIKEVSPRRRKEGGSP